MEQLQTQLESLGFAARQTGSASGQVLDSPDALEQALKTIPLHFDSLPLLFEGHSKIVRLWTDRVVALRFKPTVYSFTMNRYGNVPGTDVVRLKFTAALFRRMTGIISQNGLELRNAFLAEIDCVDGPVLIQKRVDTCNIETRVKRFHIGSPLHRYLYTEQHNSTQKCGPLRKWSRFDEPLVCFDWRHPLQDREGNRLADEPLSDDYASVWMRNVSCAKLLARETFLWMEQLFAAADLSLIDMCIFIDAEGQTIYGEISPDSMRVRIGLDHPDTAAPVDKDLWRMGATSGTLLARYRELYDRLFNQESR